MIIQNQKTPEWCSWHSNYSVSGAFGNFEFYLYLLAKWPEIEFSTMLGHRLSSIVSSLVGIHFIIAIRLKLHTATCAAIVLLFLLSIVSSRWFQVRI